MKTLIIFAKTPAAGSVKTRLVKSTPLDENQVCSLYEAFLKDTIIAGTLTMADRIAIHFTPSEGEKAIRKITRGLRLGARNDKRFVYVNQQGENFTDRVTNAFGTERESASSEVVMIGADSPTIQPAVIDEAFEFVYSRSGLALGPSGEGGVYLIGYPSQVTPDFDGVFTKNSEIENLVDMAKNMGVPLKLLPEIVDVDVESDLVTLSGILRAIDYEKRFGSAALFPSHTFKELQELKIGVVRSMGETRSKKISVGE